jgi:hypothetical protein
VFTLNVVCNDNNPVLLTGAIRHQAPVCSPARVQRQQSLHHRHVRSGYW